MSTSVNANASHLMWTRTSLVAASERLRSVHRQFCIRRWLEPVRCFPRACMPPAENTCSIHHFSVRTSAEGRTRTRSRADWKLQRRRTSLHDGRFVAGTD